jgi:hypothetical protein
MIANTVDPTVSVENVKALDQIRGESLASRTFAMQLLLDFSRRQRAHAYRDLWDIDALGRVPPARAGHSGGSRRRAATHSQSDLCGAIPPGRGGRGYGYRRGVASVPRPRVFSIWSGGYRPRHIRRRHPIVRRSGTAGLLGTHASGRQSGSDRGSSDTNRDRPSEHNASRPGERRDIRH